MTVRKRISNRRISEALEIWCGNITAAAQSLGIQPKNLRKRVKELGIDLGPLRAKGANRSNYPGSSGSSGSSGSFRSSRTQRT